ncbi:MAG TPA: prepilin-type N-terminal cleavage/methylation domain-containing protein [Candidatus Desulfobacillus denitrificans]|nr:prepilin-type N-terminal cleavage/methylation domain-containing protein [Candidatus Desulfobacillus denitrificans]HNT61757.1 prepilin-type N-terminal cleavage/methylation domain-containing protein [Candidatus Desulfobacillus denitrificans]
MRAARSNAASAAPRRLTYARGFTLAEMAVVLVIVALLIAGMMLPLSAQQDIRARQETEKTLNDIREALVGFAAANGRLPRPAVSAVNGAENPATCGNDAACSGFIPWATLGVHKLDGWNKLVRYSVTPDFANAPITLTTVANRTVQARDAGGAAIYLAGQAACNTTSQCVPAVVFSQGRRNWGTNEAGDALADESATNADEDANDTGPTNYFSRLPVTDTAAAGGEFDDMVVWLPTTILINRMIAAGKLP